MYALLAFCLLVHVVVVVVVVWLVLLLHALVLLPRRPSLPSSLCPAQLLVAALYFPLLYHSVVVLVPLSCPFTITITAPTPSAASPYDDQLALAVHYAPFLPVSPTSGRTLSTSTPFPSTASSLPFPPPHPRLPPRLHPPPEQSPHLMVRPPRHVRHVGRGEEEAHLVLR